MARDYADAVRRGTQFAARLHKKLNLKASMDVRGGDVDVFRVIHTLGLPLLLRPLSGLLGAYLSEPSPGILVTTQRQLSIQRFTAAHELGHHYMGHQPSLDDENVLRRMMVPDSSYSDPEFQEAEANAFAVAFMMPRWLIHWHLKRQGWSIHDIQLPECVYQLSLRVGASYEATCWTLLRQKILTRIQVRTLLETRPRFLKDILLEPYIPPDRHGNVWLLTERDADTQIDGSRNDLFVLQLKEHCGGGYLWDLDQLRASGFGIIRDAQEVISADEREIGGPMYRRITASPPESYLGNLQLDERRPWGTDDPLSQLTFSLDFTGPEEAGLSRAEKRSLLSVA